MAIKLFSNAVLSLIGFVLSAYSVYVEHRVEHKDESPDGDEYSALCDIDVSIAAFALRIHHRHRDERMCVRLVLPSNHSLT